MAELRISIDGVDKTRENAVIPVLDHGFLFGDSVYEVVRTWRGQLLFHEEHFARLENSAAGIALPLPIDCAGLRKEFERLHAESGFAESYLRVIITRGVGELELSIQSCEHQRMICIAKPLTVWDSELYSKGGRLALVDVVRNSKLATNPAFKTGNYLNNVLAVEEAKRAKATEALMLNANGFVTECSTSNIFHVAPPYLCTPALEVGILPGITRAKVIEAARSLGIKIEEGRYLAEQMPMAEEVFITSTTRDVMPISEIAVGDTIHKMPLGPTTKRIAKAYRELCEASLSRKPSA